MLFTIDNRRFEFLMASSVSTRDGMGWELWEYVGGDWNLLIEIFRDDQLRKIDFTAFGNIEVPFAAMEVLLNHFNENGGKDFHIYSEE
ncbi:hypothetical protein [Hymenobacter algoricola]|uniref:Uncharacterized protein n=1 Tax=Hymenobacter algoricola TaxID=486267 RepID=A0ABP7NBH6_9BACT